jgi:hypothetical protein
METNEPSEHVDSRANHFFEQPRAMLGTSFIEKVIMCGRKASLATNNLHRVMRRRLRTSVDTENRPIDGQLKTGYHA